MIGRRGRVWAMADVADSLPSAVAGPPGLGQASGLVFVAGTIVDVFVVIGHCAATEAISSVSVRRNPTQRLCRRTERLTVPDVTEELSNLVEQLSLLGCVEGANLL
ncbi:hypothetical protein CDD83_1294 [Cordyceps sp. RAO-2017]|nr:hypothetical protein CDD83_1294 [Cordyceps sp. RAO-2017]